MIKFKSGGSTIAGEMRNGDWFGKMTVYHSDGRVSNRVFNELKPRNICILSKVICLEEEQFFDRDGVLSRRSFAENWIDYVNDSVKSN